MWDLMRWNWPDGTSDQVPGPGADRWNDGDAPGEPGDATAVRAAAPTDAQDGQAWMLADLATLVLHERGYRFHDALRRFELIGPDGDAVDLPRLVALDGDQVRRSARLRATLSG